MGQVDLSHRSRAIQPDEELCSVGRNGEFIGIAAYPDLADHVARSGVEAHYRITGNTAAGIPHRRIEQSVGRVISDIVIRHLDVGGIEEWGTRPTAWRRSGHGEAQVSWRGCAGGRQVQGKLRGIHESGRDRLSVDGNGGTGREPGSVESHGGGRVDGPGVGIDRSQGGGKRIGNVDGDGIGKRRVGTRGADGHKCCSHGCQVGCGNGRE